MSFEETYPRYPFSGLVWLGIVAASFVRGLLDREQAVRAKTREAGSKVTPVSRARTVQPEIALAIARTSVSNVPIQRV